MNHLQEKYLVEKNFDYANSDFFFFTGVDNY